MAAIVAKEARRRAIIGRYGDPVKKCRIKELERYISEDAETKSFFTDYELDNGEHLGLKNYGKAVEYYNNAIVLKAAGSMLKQLKSKRRSLGIKTGDVWNAVAHAVNEVDREKYPHSLPAHERRLRERYDLFVKGGCQFLFTEIIATNMPAYKKTQEFS